MNADRMERFLEELKKIKEQREKGKCRTGHFFDGEDGCRNCGRLLSSVLEGRDVE